MFAELLEAELKSTVLLVLCFIDKNFTEGENTTSFKLVLLKTSGNCNVSNWELYKEKQEMDGNVAMWVFSIENF